MAKHSVLVCDGHDRCGAERLTISPCKRACSPRDEGHVAGLQVEAVAAYGNGRYANHPTGQAAFPYASGSRRSASSSSEYGSTEEANATTSAEPSRSGSARAPSAWIAPAASTPTLAASSTALRNCWNAGNSPLSSRSCRRSPRRRAASTRVRYRTHSSGLVRRRSAGWRHAPLRCARVRAQWGSTRPSRAKSWPWPRLGSPTPIISWTGFKPTSSSRKRPSQTDCANSSTS